MVLIILFSFYYFFQLSRPPSAVRIPLYRVSLSFIFIFFTVLRIEKTCIASKIFNQRTDYVNRSSKRRLRLSALTGRVKESDKDILEANVAAHRFVDKSLWKAQAAFNLGLDYMSRFGPVNRAASVCWEPGWPGCHVIAKLIFIAFININTNCMTPAQLTGPARLT